uniref:Uncharacterized protein n=1 Tax=Branchiostoma floridae TaxID=7739 RepID=C3XWD9_BRAFL|eukprot:XP_002611663.1 hypothetical protein BRAFLDRAFT_63661 [Branchiostoma floridae]
MCCSEEGCCGNCKYEGTCIRNLGWALVVLGVIGAILAVIADGVYPFAVVHFISAPIWGGVFIIVAGGLAVCGGNSPENACLRIALLVMSIFGINFAFVIWIVAIIGLTVDGPNCEWSILDPNWRSVDCGGIYALHGLQLLLGLTETVLMFIVSIRACCGTCCKNCCDGTQQPPTHAHVYQPGQPLPQQGTLGTSSCRQCLVLLLASRMQDSSQATTHKHNLGRTQPSPSLGRTQHNPSLGRTQHNPSLGRTQHKGCPNPLCQNLHLITWVQSRRFECIFAVFSYAHQV